MSAICCFKYKTKICRNKSSVKFLSDGQLPPSLRQLFTANGYDCIYTKDLKEGNDTADKIINKISVTEQEF